MSKNIENRRAFFKKAAQAALAVPFLAVAAQEIPAAETQIGPSASCNGTCSGLCEGCKSCQGTCSGLCDGCRGCQGTCSGLCEGCRGCSGTCSGTSR